MTSWMCTLSLFDLNLGIRLVISAASAYDNIEWINNLVAYISRIAQTKIIGAHYCLFSHPNSTASRHMHRSPDNRTCIGGECVPNGRWELGPTPLQLTDLGETIFNSDGLVSPFRIAPLLLLYFLP